MKLNPDCIRSILLEVEEVTDLEHMLRLSVEKEPNEKYLASYPPKVVFYHVKQCELSGLLEGVSWFLDGGCLIRYLSPKGHEFLADISEDTNWNKTKEVAKKVGSNSLSTLIQISSNVISTIIQSQFGL